MSAELTVTGRDTAAGPLLEFTGALDAATAPDALAAIQRHPPRAGQLLVVDLAGLRFCDSSGISVLLAAHKLALAAGATIALAAVPAQLAHFLTLAGLADVLARYPTTEAARDAWTGTTER